MGDSLRILIVDDDPMMARTLRDIFRVKGHKVEMVNSGNEALETIEQESFDCVLSDIKMPEIDGVELFKAIKAQQSDLPVVLMTAYSSDALVEEGLGEGVIATLSKPLDINLVLSFFSSLRKERSIVIVDDDPEFCRTLGDILKTRDFLVETVSDPYKVMDTIQNEGQIVLLDMKINKVGGLSVLETIRERYPHLPVILVTGYRSEMAPSIEKALELNAYACFYKPLQIDDLLHSLEAVRRQELGRMLGQISRKKQ